jgi:sec-independent protein translocase protein TatA
MEFGGMEWVIIILVVFLLFGAKKIPELARGLGQGINEFRKAANDVRKEIENSSQQDHYENRNDSQQQQQHSEPVKTEVHNTSESHS